MISGVAARFRTGLFHFKDVMNQNIVTNFDEVSRMLDLCKDNEGNVSKSFYDFYLIENNSFIKEGIFFIGGLSDKNAFLPFGFNVIDDNKIRFTFYNQKLTKKISIFDFDKQDNITMESIDVDIYFFNLEAYKKVNLNAVSPSYMKSIKNISNRIGKREKKSNKKIKSLQNLQKEALNIFYKDTHKDIAKYVVSAFFSFSYYVHNKEKEHIFYNSKRMEEINNCEEIKYLYKYNGYIDLKKNKVYKAILKKEPDDPTREYQRHIGKWSVKGHYRKTKNGLIWIDSHIKGKGELEERTYSTLNENDLKLKTKTFEVVKFRGKNKDISFFNIEKYLVQLDDLRAKLKKDIDNFQPSKKITHE